MTRTRSSLLIVLTATGGLLTAACGSDSGGMQNGGPVAQALFVAHEGFIASYDIATGAERAGTLPNVTGPVDIQAFDDGHLMVNLTGRNEVLILDGKTMLEKKRMPSSSMGAMRPVHSYISPEIDGRSFWMTFNDGAENMPATNSALFVDCKASSASYHQTQGEVAIGVGHHKAAFSNTLQRVVISNIADCDDVLSVYDFTNPASITRLATASAASLGWDGSSFPKTCDPTYQAGVPPAPHGCATSGATGKVFCNLTGSGEIAVVDIDAATPTFTRLATTGAGGGYTKTAPDGRYIYSLQSEPREGSTTHPGVACQVGQLVVIDSMSETIAAQLLLLYKGAGCTEAITGTAAVSNEPGHIRISPDGKNVFVAVGGGFMVADARSTQEVVVDATSPASPVLRPSLTVGQGTSHRADAMSGDGKYVFVVNNVDGSVTQIDAATATVVKTINTMATPQTIAIWGTAEGAGEQTGPAH
jgi:YVTN family beta-propeller protein